MVQCCVMDSDVLYLMSSFLLQTEESLDITLGAGDEMRQKIFRSRIISNFNLLLKYKFNFFTLKNNSLFKKIKNAKKFVLVFLNKIRFKNLTNEASN